MKRQYPFYVLSLSVPTEIVDVNVHPTKIEVRFSDNKFIYESLFFAVKNSLLILDKPAEISFENKRNFTNDQLFNLPNSDASTQLQFSEKVTEKPKEQPVFSDTKVPVYEKQAIQKSADIKTEPEVLTHTTEKNKYKKPEPVYVVNPIKQVKTPDVSEFKYISNDNFKQKETVIVEKMERKSKPVVIGELFKTYIVAQAGDEMLLIDKHAAHERIIFNRMKEEAKNKKASQVLLKPVTVTLSKNEYSTVIDNLSVFHPKYQYMLVFEVDIHLH